MDLDIWYPARTVSPESFLIFRNLLGLLEKRANYYTSSNAGNGLTEQVAQYLCSGFKCSDSSKLLKLKTESTVNAPAIETKFPLIIYLSSYNGMCFENFKLFEELAKNGFVVVSISSIGRYPGDMTMKKDDLMEQVFDAVAALNCLKQSSNIDFSKIGIIGYSWGSLAGVLLSGKIRSVSCLVSLDGSEFHHYGESKEEDLDFTGIRSSSEFKNMKISIPYLRLESSHLSDTSKVDSVYNFSEKLADEKFLFQIDSAQHEDFSCLPVVVKESGNCKENQIYNTILKLTLSFLDEHLKERNVFSIEVERNLNKTIRKNRHFF